MSISIPSNMEKDEEISESQQSSWQTFATFLVSLQSQQEGEQNERRTVAYCLETDKRKIWSGIECDGCHQLMLDQLKQILQLDLKDTVAMNAVTESQSKETVERSSEINHVFELTDKSIEPISDVALPNPVATLNEEEPFPESEFQMSPKVESEAHDFLRSPAEENLGSLTEGSESTNVKEDLISSTHEVSESTTQEDADPSETVKVSEPTAESELVPKRESLLDEEVEEPVTIEIAQLKVLQNLEIKDTKAKDAKPEKIMVIDATKPLLPNKLSKEKPFDLEVTFQLSGSRAIELTKQSFPYHTEVYGQNRMTRETLTLGQAPVGTLVNGELTYTCHLPEMMFPKAGSYRLQVITRLEGALVDPDFLELPFVQVA